MNSKKIVVSVGLLCLVSMVCADTQPWSVSVCSPVPVSLNGIGGEYWTAFITSQTAGCHGVSARVNCNGVYKGTVSMSVNSTAVSCGIGERIEIIGNDSYSGCLAYLVDDGVEVVGDDMSGCGGYALCEAGGAVTTDHGGQSSYPSSGGQSSYPSSGQHSASLPQTSEVSGSSTCFSHFLFKPGG